MSDAPTTESRLRCSGCGFDAPTASDEWASATHPSLGSLTQCPDCGSTDVHGV